MFAITCGKGHNYLVTSITNCQVAHITAWFAESGTHRTKKGILGGWRKGVVGMMPMFHANKASRAKVIVFADGACKEVSHGKYCADLAACLTGDSPSYLQYTNYRCEFQLEAGLDLPPRDPE